MASSGDSDLSHVAADGSVRMVDVGEKSLTSRQATASCQVLLSAATLELLERKAVPKGDVFTTAKIAGIFAAKQTPSLIPLTHPLMLSSIDVHFEIDHPANAVRITSVVKCNGQTGVEIEAMTACAVAALTVYDMCKSADKGIVITELRLESKQGGKSGDFRRE
jgi:cyclic pyranopterin monophosphate synthase